SLPAAAGVRRHDERLAVESRPDRGPALLAGRDRRGCGRRRAGRGARPAGRRGRGGLRRRRPMLADLAGAARPVRPRAAQARGRGRIRRPDPRLDRGAGPRGIHAQRCPAGRTETGRREDDARRDDARGDAAQEARLQPARAAKRGESVRVRAASVVEVPAGAAVPGSTGRGQRWAVAALNPKSSIPVPYLRQRYGARRASTGAGVPYLPYLPYLVSTRPRTHARTPAGARTHAPPRAQRLQVWRVW